MLRRPLSAALLLAGFLTSALAAPVGAVEPVHGASMFGELKYGADFEHFDYVNPNAPKGGTMVESAIGSFDNLNPFILKGTPAAGVSLIFETLTTGSLDEPFSEYGLVAESIEIPEDRSWVAFTLHPEARWHDGRPITVEDVIWSFNTLKEKGHPFYRAYYANITEAVADGERRVRMTFDGTVNRELPLIAGQMPVLPKHYYEDREFDRTTLEPPLGSGPYRIKSVDPGRRISFERVEDYWGADLPVNVGRYNFDEISYEYFRDANVALEAFKAGEYDVRVENTSKLWATGYTGPAVAAGRIKLEEIPHERGTGMQAFIFNTRRAPFDDPKVREALGYAFDFEWTNQNLFYGQYERTSSFFSNSELAATGLPGEAELALLEPYRDQLPEEVFTSVYEPPSTDGSGNPRRNLRQALQLLNEAGWTVRDGKLRNAEGQPMRFEILLVSPAFERVVLPFRKNLERLGIDVDVRTVDPAQYQNRLDDYDFDMVISTFGQSLSPGNEQRDFWGSEAADVRGGRNLIGIKNEVVDVLVDKIIQAPSRDDLIAASRALDRVLLWNHYVIPQWHIRTTRIAYWDKFERPKEDPKYGIDLMTWWIDQAAVAEVEEEQEEAGGARAAPAN
ncbi:MAG TPA: extracellular solute-binding protein [Geminicoccaceae bacterium]